MAIKEFTPEELVEIRKNPLVKSATNKQIRFAKQFKETFWQRAKLGEPHKQNVASFGLNPDILGDTRIRGIYLHLNEQVAAGFPFTDEVRKFSPENVAIDAHYNQRSSLVKIRELEHEVLYLKQELEFIKKIISADKEAELKCLLKRNRA